MKRSMRSINAECRKRAAEIRQSILARMARDEAILRAWARGDMPSAIAKECRTSVATVTRVVRVGRATGDQRVVKRANPQQIVVSNGALSSYTGGKGMSRNDDDLTAVPPDVFQGCTQQGVEMAAHYLLRGSMITPNADQVRVAQMLERLKPYLSQRRPEQPQ